MLDEPEFFVRGCRPLTGTKAGHRLNRPESLQKISCGTRSTIDTLRDDLAIAQINRAIAVEFNASMAGQTFTRIAKKRVTV